MALKIQLVDPVTHITVLEGATKIKVEQDYVTLVDTSIPIIRKPGPEEFITIETSMIIETDERVFISRSQKELLLNSLGTFVYDQQIASSEWVITHALHKYPSVSIVDTAGNVVFGNVQYDSDIQCTVTFTYAFSGKAYLN